MVEACVGFWFFLVAEAFLSWKCQTFVYGCNAVFLNIRSELGFDVNQV